MGTLTTGERCTTPPSCFGGTLAGDGSCCTSGLVEPSSASCCEGSNPVLDSGGVCCTRDNLDACGVCGGTAKFIDIRGKCCTTMLDEAGACALLVAFGWLSISIFYFYFFTRV